MCRLNELKAFDLCPHAALTVRRLPATAKLLILTRNLITRHTNRPPASDGSNTASVPGSRVLPVCEFPATDCDLASVVFSTPSCIRDGTRRLHVVSPEEQEGGRGRVVRVIERKVTGVCLLQHICASFSLPMCVCVCRGFNFPDDQRHTCVSEKTAAPAAASMCHTSSS